MTTQVVRALIGTAIVFNEPMSETRIQGYVAAFQGVDDNQILMAIRHCLKSCTFFPKPVEILDTVKKIRRGERIKTEAELPEPPPMSREQRAEVFTIIDEFKERKGWNETGATTGSYEANENSETPESTTESLEADKTNGLEGDLTERNS